MPRHTDPRPAIYAEARRQRRAHLQAVSAARIADLIQTAMPRAVDFLAVGDVTRCVEFLQHLQRNIDIHRAALAEALASLDATDPSLDDLMAVTSADGVIG